MKDCLDGVVIGQSANELWILFRFPGKNFPFKIKNLRSTCYKDNISVSEKTDLGARRPRNDLTNSTETSRGR